MENTQFFTYLLIMAGSTYLIRAIPFACIKKKIKNQYIQSFLYYMPYTVLTAMTFPTALYVTDSILAAALGLAVAVLLAIRKKGLTVVAAAACCTVLIVQLMLQYFA